MSEKLEALFPGHFPLSDSEKENIWGECIFIFDTNCLINLYRYSKETADNFLDILESIKDRCVMPHQVALEFMNVRFAEIGNQNKKHAEVIKDIDRIKESLDDRKSHPFISEEVKADFFRSIKKVVDEIEKSREVNEARYHKDPIMERVSSIFSERVREDFSDEELASIYKDANLRFDDDLPPGFKDKEKKGARRKNGDLIVWKEIIKISGEIDKDVVFVTDDAKEDWWARHGGKTLGPHPYLVWELKKHTENNLLMYSSYQFMEFAKRFIEDDVTDEAIEEARVVSERSKEFEDLDDFERRILVAQRLNEVTSQMAEYRELSRKFQLPPQMKKLLEQTALMSSQLRNAGFLDPEEGDDQ